MRSNCTESSMLLEICSTAWSWSPSGVSCTGTKRVTSTVGWTSGAGGVWAQAASQPRVSSASKRVDRIFRKSSGNTTRLTRRVRALARVGPERLQRVIERLDLSLELLAHDLHALHDPLR